MFDEYYSYRESLVKALERDVMGPGQPDEVITDPPITRYITGILFPQDGEAVDPAQDFNEDDAADAGAEDVGEWDPAVAMSYVRYPSSLGLTFAVDPKACSEIIVDISAAMYSPIDEENAAAESADAEAGDSSEDDGDFVGRRA